MPQLQHNYATENSLHIWRSDNTTVQLIAKEICKQWKQTVLPKFQADKISSFKHKISMNRHLIICQSKRENELCSQTVLGVITNTTFAHIGTPCIGLF